MGGRGGRDGGAGGGSGERAGRGSESVCVCCRCLTASTPACTAPPIQKTITKGCSLRCAVQTSPPRACVLTKTINPRRQTHLMTRVRACAAKVLRSTTGARDTSNNTPVVLIPSQPQQVTAVLHERQSQELDSADVCMEGLVEKPQPLKLEQGSAHRN